MSRSKLPKVRTGIGIATASLVTVALAANSAGASAAPVPAVTSMSTAVSAAGSVAPKATTAFAPTTATPIKHLVVIYGENVSFDHYFGTYPLAANTDGVPFLPRRNTPTVNNYLTHRNLLNARSATHPHGNPNATPPFRLGHDQPITCDQGHNYTPEQKSVDGGAMDQFVPNVSNDSCGLLNQLGQTMGYYDGNTVTAMWNYAQHFAMSDNSWSDTFGPSTPGALEVVSGQTHGVMSYDPTTGTDNPTQTTTPDAYTVHAPDGNGVGTVIGDPDPVYDDCSDANHTKSYALAGMQDTNKNIGDLMSAKGVSWGWFQGGFAPDVAYAGPGTYAQCTQTSANVTGAEATDYNPHHEPFQYYKSTSNPHHLPPTSNAEIGHDGQANHQYDLSLFFQALHGTDGATLPSVSYVKARNAQDGHAAYSGPLDEQHFIVRVINQVMRSKYWKSTAVILAYDDSDGWYDHVAPTITNSSSTADDVNTCTDPNANGVPMLGGYQDRCGPGQRLPLLVISPYAKRNYVATRLTTQSSIVRFIEDNWGVGQIGDGSFADNAGSIDGMFHFGRQNLHTLLLRQNGTVRAKQLS